MGLTRPRAAQIFNIDYKQAVRAVTVSNITLSGGAPNLIDGVNLSVNDRILVTGQSSPIENGLYYVQSAGVGSNGTWLRTGDANDTGEVEAGMIVMVTEGTTYADTQWKLTTNNPIFIGATPLTFVQNYSANSISSGTSNIIVGTSSNVRIDVGGIGNVAVFSTTGEYVTGVVSATGNITGNYIIGNGSQLTGLPAGYANANINSYFESGNLTANILPSGNAVYSLGNATNQWKSLYVSNTTIYIGGTPVTVTGGQLAVNGNSVVTSGQAVTGNITTTANVIGSYIIGNGSTLTSIVSSSIVGAVANATYALTANVSTYSTNAIQSNVANVANSVTGSNVSGTVANATYALTANASTYSTNAIQANIANIANSITGSNVSGTVGLAQYVTQSSQGNITSVGTLTLLSVTGNTTSGNLLTGGLISAAGNIIGSNLSTGGNVIAVNGSYTGYLSVAGNIYANSIVSPQTLVVTDPLVYFQNTQTYPYTYDIGFYSGFIGGAGNTYQHTGLTRDYTDGIWKLFSNVPEPSGSSMDLTNAIYDPIKTGNISVVGTNSATGNVTGGNLLTGGLISATGNVTGAQIIGNGAPLTSITGANVTGTVANATYATSAGSATTATTAGTVTTAAQGNITSIGTLTSLSVTGNTTSGNLLTGGLISATGNITGGNVLGGANVNATTHTGTTVSVTGNITSGNLLTGGLISATGNITSAANISGSNLIGTVATASQTSITSVGTLGSLSVTGNITGGNLSVGTGTITGGNIVNSNANGVGNIGSSTTYFNTVFAKATSAQYADLAEMYVSDRDYAPGTVVEFGGEFEITATTQSHSPSTAGIISTNPSYLMNSTQNGNYVLPVALVGRVPCQVVGRINKGDRLVASNYPGVATKLVPAEFTPGCIIGKALESYDSENIGTIEVAVGRT
jgi:hypothetical protein